MDATAPGSRRDAHERARGAERTRGLHRGAAQRSADRVELTFPNSEQFSSLTRMTGAALASAAGFSVAEIDSLRSALDRAWAILHEGTPAGHVVHLGFDATDHQLHLDGSGAPAAPGTPAPAKAVELDLTWRSTDPGRL